jgi:hypothetical protein
MTKTIQLKTLFLKPPKEKEDPDKKVKIDPEEDPKEIDLKEIDPKEIDPLENKENLENQENLGNQEVKEDLKIKRLLLNEKNLIYKNIILHFFLGAQREQKSNKN